MIKIIVKLDTIFILQVNIEVQHIVFVILWVLLQLLFYHKGTRSRV